MHAESGKCAMCGKTFPLAKLRPLGIMSHATVAAVHAEHPDLASDALICGDGRSRCGRRRS